MLQYLKESKKKEKKKHSIYIKFNELRMANANTMFVY